MLDADIESLEWVRIPKGGTLNVRQENKPTSVFAGFRDQVQRGLPVLCCGVLHTLILLLALAHTVLVEIQPDESQRCQNHSAGL